LGLGSRANFLPGLLSGGEQQRVAIARTARDRNKAIVIVSHDARLKEVADRVLWMEDGRIA
jgi:putative ABC transport system ATP-binding protein